VSDLLKRKTVTILTLEAAKAIGNAAEVEAAANGWNIAVAIVDTGANLLYFARSEEASLASLRGAVYKATTAVTFTRTTKEMGDAVAQGRLHYFAFPKTLPVEGGIPIVVDGTIIGGVGIGGTTTDGSADRCASAGLRALTPQATKDVRD
jgi:glc operon protein GlcG